MVSQFDLVVASLGVALVLAVAAAARGGDVKQAPIPTPDWAKGARVLAATYGDLPRLDEIRDRFHASVLILYHVPEISNGWCPQGTWKQVEAFVAAAHRRGFKVLGYFDGTLAEEKLFAGEHRGWVQRNRKGEPQHYQPSHIPQHRYAYCFNSPWHDRWVRIAQREARLGIDGMFVDNPDYYAFHGEGCFCPHCQRLFREQTGGDIFTAPAAVRRRWLSGRLGWHVRDIHGSLSRANPRKQFVVTSNTCGKSPHRSMKNLGPNENVLFREGGGAFGPKARATVVRDQRDGGRKPLWYILTTGTRWTSQTGRLYERLIASVVAAGACPMVWGHNYSADPTKPGFSKTDTIYKNRAVGDAVADAYGFMQRHRKRLIGDSFLDAKVRGASKTTLITVQRTEREVVIQVVNAAGDDLAGLDLKLRLPDGLAPAALKRFSPRPPDDRGFTWTPSPDGWSRLQVSKMRVWDLYAGQAPTP